MPDAAASGCGATITLRRARISLPSVRRGGALCPARWCAAGWSKTVTRGGAWLLVGVAGPLRERLAGCIRGDAGPCPWDRRLGRYPSDQRLAGGGAGGFQTRPHRWSDDVSRRTARAAGGRAGLEDVLGAADQRGARYAGCRDPATRLLRACYSRRARTGPRETIHRNEPPTLATRPRTQQSVTQHKPLVGAGFKPARAPNPRNPSTPRTSRGCVVRTQGNRRRNSTCGSGGGRGCTGRGASRRSRPGWVATPRSDA